MTIVRDAMITQTKQACTVVCFDPLTGLMLATHRKDDFSSWGMPGGKVDEGETPIDAALRELSEETPYVVKDKNNMKFLCEKICVGDVIYNVHVFIVEAQNLCIDLKLPIPEQNYAWITPRLLTFGSFAYFNKSLFTEHKDIIFGKFYPYICWDKVKK